MTFTLIICLVTVFATEPAVLESAVTTEATGHVDESESMPATQPSPTIETITEAPEPVSPSSSWAVVALEMKASEDTEAVALTDSVEETHLPIVNTLKDEDEDADEEAETQTETDDEQAREVHTEATEELYPVPAAGPGRLQVYYVSDSSKIRAAYLASLIALLYSYRAESPLLRHLAVGSGLSTAAIALAPQRVRSPISAAFRRVLARVRGNRYHLN